MKSTIKKTVVLGIISTVLTLNMSITASASCMNPFSLFGGNSGSFPSSISNIFSNSKQSGNCSSNTNSIANIINNAGTNKSSNCNTGVKGSTSANNNCNTSNNTTSKNSLQDYILNAFSNNKSNTCTANNNTQAGNCTTNNCTQTGNCTTNNCTQAGNCATNNCTQAGNCTTNDCAQTGNCATNNCTQAGNCATNDCTKTGTCPTTDKENSGTNTTTLTYAEEVLKYVNEARADNGLTALALDSKLGDAADIRAKEIAIKFSHTRPDGTSCFTVFKELNITYRSCGENIASGYKTAKAVTDAWLASPGHRANILSSNFKYMGIGKDNNNWAQLFKG